LHVPILKVVFEHLNNQAEATVPIIWIQVDSCQFSDGNTIEFYQIQPRLGLIMSNRPLSGNSTQLAPLWPERIRVSSLDLSRDFGPNLTFNI
jgi:hypothetical protein